MYKIWVFDFLPSSLYKTVGKPYVLNVGILTTAYVVKADT